jgi:hypothetical protein
MLSLQPSLSLTSGFFSSGFTTRTLHIFLLSPCLLYSLPIWSSLTSSFQLFLAKITSYDVSHYTVFSNRLLFRSSSIKIFSSAPCPQTPSVYVLPLILETKCHTHTKLWTKYSFEYFNFYDLESTQEDKRFWNETLPEFNLLLISSLIKFWFVTVVSKYLNFTTLCYDFALHSGDETLIYT